ncbi:general substrate transporter [Polychaeton citri CBS 116435]|uniref:General substrate transporter n=1 Tax=Polychaeton citri CBS 116435 TaxID=1314669 RepID=A0A9P4QGW3_9PEZI|nr:general substrate transporter [Polychaeton citri CBS 116435]
MAIEKYSGAKLSDDLSNASHTEDTSKDASTALANISTAEFPDRLAEQVSYGPGGVRGLVANPYVLGAAFLASLGGFSFGYDQGVISVINVMPQFHAAFPRLDPDAPGSEFWTGFMTGMLELGAFLGCFFFPKLADTISRKWALSVVAIIFNVGAIMQTAAPDFAVLVAGRTITGIGVGTMALGAPLYISEIAPPEVRGALLVLESISIVSGVVLSYWISYGTRFIDSEASFRVPFGLQMVSAAGIGIGIHLFPYSPRWLALVKREDDALESLAKLRRLPKHDERIVLEWRGIMAEAEFQSIMLKQRHPGKKGFKLEVATWLDLFTKKVWRRTAVGMGVAFFQQFSGINAFIYYAPKLFSALGQTDELSLILAGTLNIGQLVAVVLCFFIIDRVGRRTLAIWGGFTMGVPYVIIAALYGLYSHNWPAYPAAGWACVAMAYIYILAYGVSYSPLAWALPSECFSTAQRSKGVAISTATVWLCNFIIGVAVPPMIAQAGFGTYVFFACFCFLAGIWAILLVPETKNKTLEELDEVFGDGSAREEHEIMRQAAASALRRGSDTIVASRRASLA